MVDAVERPAVAVGDVGQLALGFRKRNVETRVATADAVEEELEGEGRLAPSRGCPRPGTGGLP
jgi:hypothetical protein